MERYDYSNKSILIHGPPASGKTVFINKINGKELPTVSNNSRNTRKNVFPETPQKFPIVYISMDDCAFYEQQKFDIFMVFTRDGEISTRFN